jgi:hypothetical protein
MEIMIVLGILLVLAVAALLWGADSRDEVNSPEWAHRKEWYENAAS